MNTGFLNRCRLLVSSRSRALLIGQTLCLMVIAAIFVVSPFVALAGGCGQQNKQQQANNAILQSAQQTAKSVQLVALIKSLSPRTVPNALNASTLKVPAGATMDGAITIVPPSNAPLQEGDWVMIKTGNAMYPATVFGINKINGKTVAEVWPAETPVGAANPVNVGHKFFVTLDNFTGGAINGTVTGN